MTSTYRERLSPPWWAWLIVVGFAISVGGIYGIPYGGGAGVLAFVIAAACAGALAVGWTPTLTLDGSEFTAGRAHIHVRFIAGVTALDDEAARQLRGRDSDPRAWMLLRAWIPTAVRIDLDDADDPTPYWFVSTRHPVELAAAVIDARNHLADA